MLDIAGVDQPWVEPVGLQQVEHRLPVRRRRLHHHPLDSHLDEVIGQLSERARHGRMRRHLRQPPFTPGRGRHPHTAHQLRLTNVQGRHPGNDLLLIMRFGQHDPSSPHCHSHLFISGCGRLRMSHGDNDSDPRARPSGNSEGPNSDIRRPARYTASQDHSVRRRRQATTTQFSSPKGDRGVRKARALNLHWGLPHLWLYRPGPTS